MTLQERFIWMCRGARRLNLPRPPPCPSPPRSRPQHTLADPFQHSAPTALCAPCHCVGSVGLGELGDEGNGDEDGGGEGDGSGEGEGAGKGAGDGDGLGEGEGKGNEGSSAYTPAICVQEREA